MSQGGEAGRITQLKTTRGFEHPDGMRAYGKNGLLVVEGASAGRFDMVELNGDNAEVKMVKSGFKQPVSVWQIGNTAWVLEGQLARCSIHQRSGASPDPSAHTRWSCRDNSRSSATCSVPSLHVVRGEE